MVEDEARDAGVRRYPAHVAYLGVDLGEERLQLGGEALGDDGFEVHHRVDQDVRATGEVGYVA